MELSQPTIVSLSNDVLNTIWNICSHNICPRVMVLPLFANCPLKELFHSPSQNRFILGGEEKKKHSKTFPRKIY